MNLSFKNTRLYLRLKHEISAGKYDGGTLPPERDFIKELGVSRNTLRFALRLLEQEGALLRIRSKGTFPVRTPAKAEPERFLYCSDTRHDPASHVYTGIICGIHAEARKTCRDIDLCPLKVFSRLPLSEAEIIFQERNIKGVILSASAFSGKERICKLLGALHIPVILTYCNESDPSVTGYAAIVRPLRQAWLAALRYLTESGHERIITLSLPEEIIRDIFSCTEYKSMLETLGLSAKECPVIRCQPSETDLKIKLAPFFERMETHPDAVLCYADSWAPAVYRVLQAFHLRIPEDISVMGYCGSLSPDFITPELSTIEIGYEEIGHIAVRILNESSVWFDKPGIKPPEIMAPYMLKIRSSTPIFGGPHPE